MKSAFGVASRWLDFYFLIEKRLCRANKLLYTDKRQAKSLLTKSQRSEIANFLFHDFLLFLEIHRKFLDLIILES